MEAFPTFSPDGQHFLVLKPPYDDSQVRELHVVTNWFEELKCLVIVGESFVVPMTVEIGGSSGQTSGLSHV